MSDADRAAVPDAKLAVIHLDDSAVMASASGVVPAGDTLDSPVAGGLGRIARNFAVVAAFGVVAKIIGLFTGIYIRRTLGPEVNGILGWNLAVLGYIGLITNPGVTTIAKREVAKRPGRSTAIFYDRVIGQLLLAVPAALVTLGVAYAIRHQPYAATLLAVQTIGLFVTAIGVEWLFEAHERMILPNAVNLVVLLAQAPLLLWLVRSPHDGVWYVAYSLCLQTAAAATLFFLAYRSGLLRGRRVSWQPRRWWPVFIEALPVTLSSAAIMLYYNCDVFLLGVMSDNNTTGQYSTAYTLMLMVFGAIVPMWTAFMPQMTVAIDDPPTASELSRRLYRGLAIVGCGFAAVGFCFGPELVRLLYGPQYDLAGRLFAILSLNAIFLGINTAITSPFNIWGKQAWMLWITLASAAANFAANVVLIPRYGVWSAVWTTLGAETIVLVCGLVARRRLVPFPIAGDSLRIGVAFVSVSTIVLYAKSWAAVPWWLLFAGLLAVCAVLTARLEPAIVRRVWQKVRPVVRHS